MKQLFKLTLAAVLVCTACSNDRELGNSAPETSANAIGFQVIKKNVLTRGSATIGSSTSTNGLEDAGHYNFGVFAYKDIDPVNNIMANYLVGYHGTDNKGYAYTPDVSGWYYQGLGNSEYSYTGSVYYDSSTDVDYMSNIDVQHLRYWDKASASTSFYAYAPYIHGGSSVTYNNGTQTMTFPAGTIVDGYNDLSKYEYMYATTTVAQAQYGNSVQLNFNRLTAKVNIKFYETIAGYRVKILNLKEGTYEGVCAAPAVRSGSVGSYTYTYGTVYKSSGLDIKFSTPVVFDWNNQVAMVASTDYLSFEAPAGIISETNTAENPATPSATTYYAIPKAMTTPVTSDGTGLTFHVTYQLISNTNETITVHNATVFVPAEYCQWVANYAYTYVFKITKNSSGTTATDTGIDPSDPDAKDGEQGLFPIVFDNCTVEAWETENDHEANIN